MLKIALGVTLQVILLFNLVLFKGCSKAVGFATTLRVVVAAGAPILTQFVQQGKISAAFKDNLVADLNEEAGYVATMASCFDVIPEKDPASKSKHLQCVKTFESSTRPLLERHFALNQNVKYIADDIEAVIQGAIIFYGGGGLGVNPNVKPVSEDEIKGRIEKLKKSLGQTS